MYMGGKYRTRHKILAAILADTNRRAVWVEPFCGAAWVTKLAAPNFDRVLASDLNADVIAYWQAVQTGWVPPPAVTEDDYREARLLTEPSAYRAHVLINCSFGGKWARGYARRGKRKGDPYYYPGASSRRDAKDAPLLTGVDFTHGPYQSAPVTSDSVVYCDPPYEDTTAYDAIGKFDSGEFWAMALSWAELGAHVYVSEYDSPDIPAIREVWSGEHARSIRSTSSTHTTERLFRVHTELEGELI